MLPFHTEIERPGDFPYLFTSYSSCIWKFVICLFVDEEANEKYLFANRLNGLNGLAHLCCLVFLSTSFINYLCHPQLPS